MDLAQLIPLLAFLFSVLLNQAGTDAAAVRLMRCPPRQLKGGRVRLRSKGRVAKYVCLRGSQVLGDKYSTCILGNWDTPVPICIKSGCSPVSVPHGQVLDTYRGALVTVHCDPGYSLVGSQSLFCDGTRWNGTSPLCKELKVSAQKWCDFENEDLCGWTHDTNGDFDWRRHNFATPSGHVGTGPSSDHTLGPGLHGHYMYLETSSPRLENDTARLFSPIFPAANETSCFIFWYHMFGPTTGTLNVYLHHKETLLLFSQTGNQGDQWLQAVLPLPPMPSSFQIMIEGVRGNGYEGDTAIDDVKLTQGEECIAASTNSVEESSRAGDTDGSSCVNRCSINVPDPSWCECSSDCLQNNTCCPDYLQECQNQGSTSEQKELHPTKQPDQKTSSDLNLETEMSSTNPPGEVLSSESNFSESRPIPSSPTMPKTSLSVEHTTKVPSTSISTTMKIVTNTSDSYSMASTKSSANLTTILPTSKLTTTSSTTTMAAKTPTSPVVTAFQTTLSTKPQQQNITLEIKSPTTLPIKILNITSKASFDQTITLAPKVVLSTLKPMVKQNVPKLEFITPPPPIIFRLPTTFTTLPMAPKRNVSTIFTKSPKYPRLPLFRNVFPTTTNPKYSKNLTAEVAKSRNDVLHPVWTNRTFPIPPPLPPLEPVPKVATLKPTTRRTTTSVSHTEEYKWKSKYIKPKANPVTEQHDQHRAVQEQHRAVQEQHRAVQEQHRAVQEQQLSGHSTPDHFVHLVVMICGVLLILSSILATVCVLRRRKINRRNNEDDDLDIRFLASDEMLDFTLARPSPVRETAR